MPAATTNRLSGDPYIDGLLGEVKWAVTKLTFSFPTTGALYESPYGYGEPRDDFESLNAAQQFAARMSLEGYASVSNLEFTELTEKTTHHADIRYGMSDTPPTAWAYLPSTSPEGGDVWFNNSGGFFDKPVKVNYAYASFMHETGHALGLHHPHSFSAMPLDRDSLEYTIMSYRSYVGASTSSGYTNETWGYPQSLMMYDIAAVQRMYGPNYDTNSGNTTYSWSPTTGEMSIDGAGQGAPGANRIFLTVWDGGGIDTYDFSNYATDLDIDLGPGEWTTTATRQLAKLHYDGSQVATGNIANALLFEGDPRSLIEKAKGGQGDDVVTGNSAANTLWGHDGEDILYGGAGADTLVGGYGDDRLHGEDDNDRLYGDDGRDMLDGGHGNDLVAGQGGDDTLYGGDGDDIMKGGDGHDLLDAGPGDDRLYGQNGDDRAYGGDGNDILIGAAGGDALFGGNGNDVLRGGMERDLLVGEEGADRFVFSHPTDSPPSLVRDTILDFSSAEGDRIDLRRLDADVATGADDAFNFIGTDMFSGIAGELGYFVTSGGHAIARGDMNGDAREDFHVVVAFTSELFAGDFLL